ncbi:MAG TPA: flagellar hook-length control protein FliK, partial [Candidatus Tectomicrobia bacterium]
EELQALPGSLPQGSSHTQFGVNVRQAATSLPGANLLAPYPGQSTGMAQPEAVIPTTADGVSSAAVLSLPMGNLPQAGEEGTRVFSMPGTATLLQTDKLKLAESPALEPVGVLSQPSTDISVRPPEDVPESLAPRGHHTALEAVTRQVGPLPRHTILLQLEPPELGHVRVQIRLLDERLAAAFWADSSEVRALLQAHLPMLHQALNQQGFQTHQLSITPSIDGSVDTAGQFAHQHSAFQQFAQEGERRTLDSIRVPLASQELLTYKNEHNGLVNVVI